MFQIISQFALSFLQQTYLQKVMLSINIKEPLIIKTPQEANEAYSNFILTFCDATIYDTFFPMNNMKIKIKDFENPWITKGIKKSSKKKRTLAFKLKKKKKKKKK